MPDTFVTIQIGTRPPEVPPETPGHVQVVATRWTPKEGGASGHRLASAEVPPEAIVKTVTLYAELYGMDPQAASRFASRAELPE